MSKHNLADSAQCIRKLDSANLLTLFTKCHRDILGANTSKDQELFKIVEEEILSRLNQWAEKYRYLQLGPCDPGFIGSRSEKSQADCGFHSAHI